MLRRAVLPSDPLNVRNEGQAISVGSIVATVPFGKRITQPPDQDSQTAKVRIEGQATVESGRAGVGYLSEGSDGGFTVKLSEEDECSTQHSRRVHRRIVTPIKRTPVTKRTPI